MGNSLRIRGEPRSPGRHVNIIIKPPNILQVRAGEQRDVVPQRDGFRNGVSESWSAGGKYEDGEWSLSSMMMLLPLIWGWWASGTSEACQAWCSFQVTLSSANSREPSVITSPPGSVDFSEWRLSCFLSEINLTWPGEGGFHPNLHLLMSWNVCLSINWCFQQVLWAKDYQSMPISFLLFITHVNIVNTSQWWLNHNNAN